MYSIDGPWTPQEEDELLRHYGFVHVEGLENVWQLVRPGPKGAAEVFSRTEALESIRKLRRAAYEGT